MSVSEVTCNELLKTVIKSCCWTGFPIIFGCLESWLVHRFGTDAHRMFTSSRWSMMAAATPLMSDVMLAVAGDNAYDFLIFYVLHIFFYFWHFKVAIFVLSMQTFVLCFHFTCLDLTKSIDYSSMILFVVIQNKLQVICVRWHGFVSSLTSSSNV